MKPKPLVIYPPAVRAAMACMRLSGRVQGDIPDELLSQWGAVQDMAKVIEREMGVPPAHAD